MVGRVLRNRDVVKKVVNYYQPPDFNELKTAEISNLIRICDDRIEEYISKRGEAIWEHRRKSKGYISGSIKYEVPKRAKFMCELCGISAEEKAFLNGSDLRRKINYTDWSLGNILSNYYKFIKTKKHITGYHFQNRGYDPQEKPQSLPHQPGIIILLF